jgi:hypothetical protein
MDALGELVLFHVQVAHFPVCAWNPEFFVSMTAQACLIVNRRGGRLGLGVDSLPGIGSGGFGGPVFRRPKKECSR